MLYPFFSKIADSFKSAEDFVDVTIRLIPKHFTLDTYKYIILERSYFQAFATTFAFSFGAALIQTFICCLIGYGLAKFKFKGNKLVFLLVILTMIIPHRTLQFSMYMHFRYFDIGGIMTFLSGGSSIGIEAIDNLFAQVKVLTMETPYVTLTNTPIPLLLLSLTGLGFKNGLYIFMLKQFFAGIPDELEESAYLDGAGTGRTFLQIIIPLSVPMMITVFLLAFCWQWTDVDYLGNYFYTPTKIMTLITTLTKETPESLRKILEASGYAGKEQFQVAINNTCGILIVTPLVILYLFCQKYLVQGIERTGLTAD